MILQISILIFCIVSGWGFACLAGYFEAYYYDMIPSTKNHRNLHPFYVIQRGILWVSQAILFYGVTMDLPDNYYWWGMPLIFIVTTAFAYPFWHDGVLYATRNTLNPDIYKDRFWADKEPSTTDDANKAIFDITVIIRIAMFIMSLIFTGGLILEIITQ